MKITILVLFALVAIVASMPRPDDEVSVTDEEWEDFKKTHTKSYDNAEEEEKRRGLYLNKKKFIEEHNKKFNAGLETYTLGINQFADLTDEELKKCCGGVVLPGNLPGGVVTSGHQ